MQYLELHNVEYGECIVLGGKCKDIFMVDCGSINQKIREGDVDFSEYIVQNIARRYHTAPDRRFLLTHFHRDHLCGLNQILHYDPHYFSRIYLPYSPQDRRGNPLLLEFALFVYVFLSRQTNYSQMNVSALKIFDRMASVTGCDCIYTLKADDTFSFDGITYDVLWPQQEEYPFNEMFSSIVEDLNVCLSSPFLGSQAGEFLQLKERFGQEYLACCKAFREQNRAPLPVREQAVANLTSIMEQIDAIIPELNLLPTVPDIVEILNRPVTRTAYSEAVNAASIIFHNHRSSEASYDDILMTGDATPDSMDVIGDRLYDGYYLIKAPHHGTASGWSHWFNEISAAHILISNGDYHAGGDIAEEYVNMQAIKHCTNNSACRWFTSTGCSCNRLACCYEQYPKPGLTIKCPAVARQSKFAGCNIYIIMPGGERACLCDNLPTVINN